MNFKETLLEQVIFPEGVYISLSMTSESSEKVKEYCRRVLPDMKLNEHQHLTLIFSKKPSNEMPILKQYKTRVKFKGFSLFGPNKDTLVAEVESVKLVDRNKELVKKYNYVSDYDEYKPHFTLGYGVSGLDLDILPPLDFVIEFDQERVERLNLDWEKNKI